MPQIYLCFLWHMHQPFYKDLITGEYTLPWTRLHALKEYYGRGRILEEGPKIHQTFNLFPSMMVQVAEYASGKAQDPFLECAAKPADALTDAERDLILEHFFHAHPERMIHRYPRYAELYEARRAQQNPAYARQVFAVQEFRDLQVLSQIAWFDEGKATLLAHSTVTSKQVVWHLLRVRRNTIMSKEYIEVFFDGAQIFSVEDKTFGVGRIGLITLGAATAEFDNLTAAPLYSQKPLSGPAAY